jgi:hypothetical protein
MINFNISVMGVNSLKLGTKILGAGEPLTSRTNFYSYSNALHLKLRTD